jgi:curved DNA-binding protein CbpA
MATPLPPDPYLALGLPRDASAATIKTTYRKLILKFHPDKVQDAAQKQIASDQFHKVQTAYEIIGDEDRRARYDAQCKLVELKKDML